jgi:S1-C subfamily serine protease
VKHLCPIRAAVIAALAVLAVGLTAQAQPGAPAPAPTPQHGYLGVMLVPARDAGAGIVVQEVTPDSPAAKSGLKSGDRVVKLGSDEVRDVGKFLQTVGTKKPGEKLTLGVMRDGKEQNLTVTLGEWPARTARAFPAPPGGLHPAFIGVQMQDLTPELKDRLKVQADAGAVITDVVPDSPAAKAGLKRDDVITAVDSRPVNGPTDLQGAIQTAVAGKEITLQVARGKEKLSIKATPREGQPGAPGFFPVPGDNRRPPTDIGPMGDPNQRIRELERRIDDLENRLRKLEKK